MREAGFSSTAVKTNIEDSLSSSPVFQLPSINASYGVFSSPPSPTRETAHHHKHQHHQLSPFWPPHFLSCSPERSSLFFPVSPLHKFSETPTGNHHHNHPRTSPSLKEDDVKLVMEVMLREKRRNTVIVGDSVSITEGLVMEINERLGSGDVPSELKPVSFIKFHLHAEALRFMNRDDVEMKYLSDLRRKVEQSSSGAIVYVGDLKWAAIHDDDDDETTDSAVGHLVKEIGKLAHGGNRVWVLGIASFQTYIKCQMKFRPPLDLQWGVQAVSIPSGGLCLSLHSPSLNDESSTPLLKSSPSSTKEAEQQLGCCGECTSNFEKEAGSSRHMPVPSWLQPLGTAPSHEEELMELRRKWSGLCRTLHQGKRVGQAICENSASYTTSNQTAPVSSKQYAYRWPSGSISFASPNPRPAGSIPRFRRQNSCTLEFDLNRRTMNGPPPPNLSSLRTTESRGDVKITLGLGNDAGSLERTVRRAEMCRMIKDYVPWQSENVPGIVEALMMDRGDTWLLITGNDRAGKIRLASAIGESVFGSASSVLYLNMRTDSFDQLLGKATGTLGDHVVLVEDVDFAENRFIKFLIDRFESGNREGGTGRVVFVLTKGSPVGYECGGNPKSVLRMVLKVDAEDSGKKRKAEMAAYMDKSSTKSPRILDLNVGVDDYYHEDSTEAEPKQEDLSPISSDLTRENNTGDQVQSPGEVLLDMIENRFSLNRSPARDREMREFVAAKIKGSFDEAINKGGVVAVDNKVVYKVNLGIEDRVLEGVLGGGGDSFIHNVFEKWLRDIFQACVEIEREKFYLGDGISGVRLLCLREDEKGDGGGECGKHGFLGTNLPDKVSVSFV
ncbi:hypothetical protein SAY86_009260 [Trapa natans]|uniref:SMAX1-like nucleotide binding domain-containing protein n=1 Tax=Trapa natans TaxID=22666 RepID=A0AAN7L3M1_TRANT|nr:hypothetical protein SAY86_009260 [Trapa natans]